MYREIKDAVNEALAIAREYYPNATIRTPSIELSNLMTSCAGKAIYNRYSQPVVRFSVPIIEDNSLQEFIDRTVYHEVAHIVEFDVFGTSGHGSRFKFIQGSLFKKNNSRCHNFKTKPRQRRERVEYTCDQCGQVVLMGAIQHKKHISGRANYKHNGCRNGTLSIVKG